MSASMIKVTKRFNLACLFLMVFLATSIELDESARGSATASLSSQDTCAGRPLYAKHAASEKRKIKSPDGNKTVLIKSLYSEKRDQYISITLHAGKLTYETELDGWDPEVLWSPDSSRFAINQTTGGGGIGHETYVFSVVAGRMRMTSVSPPVEKAFGSPVECEVPVPPNTAIIRWLDGDTVLVVAEVVPVSICKCSGSFRSYVVSLTDLSIKGSYSQAETTRLFSNSLGCELQAPQSACAIGELRKSPPNANFTRYAVRAAAHRRPEGAGKRRLARDPDECCD